MTTGQVLVDRQVASSGAGDGQAGLGRGQDRRPDLDGGLEPRGARRRAHPERGAALVDAVVVGDVRPAPQHDADGLGQRPRPAQLLGDDVRIRAPAAGDHDLAGIADRAKRGAEAVGDLAGRRGHRPDRVLPLRQRLAADDPLVDGEPRQLERIGGLDRGRHGLRLVGRPDARAPADHPDVDEDREPPPTTRQPRGHPLDAGDRIGQDQQLGSRRRRGPPPIQSRPASSTTSLAMRIRSTPASSATSACHGCATVMAQAPASTWRRKIAGAIVVLPCGANEMPNP